MPGPVIRPDLKPLTPQSRNFLLSNTAGQPDDIILHYLQTGEIKLGDITKLPQSRIDLIKERYDNWLSAPDPQEINAWEALKALMNNPFADMDELETRLREFIRKYPNSSHKAEAEAKLREISRQRNAAKIGAILTEWKTILDMPEGNISLMNKKEVRMDEFIHANRNILDTDTADDFKRTHAELKKRIAAEDLKGIRFDFDELVRFIRRQQPGSDLFNLADEYLWNLVKEDLDVHMLKRFVAKVPQSSHNREAQEILNSLSEWKPIKDDGDIFDVYKFLEDHDDLPDAIREEAEDLIAKYKRSEIELMEQNPSAYDRRRFLSLIKTNVISVDELIRRNLITDESYIRAENRDNFIRNNPIQVQYVDSELLHQDDITDVYLFGVPSTGKTCVLMGLLGSDIYDWNSAIAAGEYGDILTLYRDNQTLPERTLDKQFFCIHGKSKDGNGKEHLINVIELAGEQFLDKIAMNPEKELSLLDMDAIAAEHLKNKNRKIFFIVIDPTVKEIEHKKEVRYIDENGNECKEKQSYRVAQKTVIKKMLNILRDPKNEKIMKSVDALHFIATKADVIDHAGKDIKDCVMDYNDSIRTAYELCQPNNAQINEATGYKPKLYSFSLGKFYVGGAFEYDSSDSDKLMRVITENTLAIRNYSAVEKIVDKILNYKIF